MAFQGWTGEFYAFKINEIGVNTTPIISPVGSILLGSYDFRGQMKFSPNGKKLALAHRSINANIESTLELYDFDKETGVVSNKITLGDEFYYYGIEFSPNSSVVYFSSVGSNSSILQFNLLAGDNLDIINSKYEVFMGTAGLILLGSLQLGPDGRIYIAKLDSEYLNVIENPNGLGASCNFAENEIHLSGRLSKLGLPPFIQSFFHVGFEFENGCEGEEIEFLANISEDFGSILWDFGDGTTSVEENPSHTYTEAGEYIVKLTVTSTETSIEQEETISIYPNPEINSFVELKQCDDDLDGFSSFNLTEVNSKISDNHLNETITFYQSEEEAINGTNEITNFTTYTNQTVSNDLVWARVENEHGCYKIAQVSLLVSTSQIPNTFLREIVLCDNGIDTTDGISTFNLSSINEEIEDLFPNGQEITISYYQNLEDALAEENSITDLANYRNTNSPNFQELYVRVENEENNDCIGLGNYINLKVVEVPILNMAEEWFICEDEPIEIIADAGYDEYLWSTGATTQSITVNTTGEYEVTVTNIEGEVRCETTKTVTVLNPAPPTIQRIETIDWTYNNNQIIIFVEGDSEYEYSLDGINYQDYNRFSNLLVDEYTVYVRDKLGCKYLITAEVYLIYYPNFFTPNGDGINDTWQLYNAEKEPDNKITIFDRYGKTLKKLKPSEQWNGMYNGENLPTGGYWFILERENGQTYNGSIIIKRR